MTPQMYVAPAAFVKLPEKKKKSACKINENDLKIAWKCTLRQSNFKNFPGEVPRTPLMRDPTFLYSPPLAAYTARYMPSAVNAPPPSVFRPGSSPDLMIIMGYFFSYFSIKTCRGYSLGAPRRGASYEYLHHICFLWRIREHYPKIQYRPKLLLTSPLIGSLFHIYRSSFDASVFTG